MTPRGSSSYSRCFRCLTAAAFGVVTLSSAVTTANADPFPLPVRVQVTEEGAVAPDRSLRLLEIAILTELRQCGCSPGATAGLDVDANSVVLRVILKEVIEDANWDMQTGARAEAVQRGGESAVSPTTVIRVQGQALVLAGPERTIAQSRNFWVSAEWKSKAPGVDPAEAARQQALNKLAVEARKALCNSRRKLLTRIDELSGRSQR